jgi:glycosyltransferase involved in cell wall biosynthesis
MTSSRVEVPYLLALFGVPVYQVDGENYVDDLWAQDLRQHVAYIPDLTLFCYSQQCMPEHWVKLADCPILSRLRIVTVPKPRSTLQAIKMLPATVRALWRATKGMEVVHSEVAGWPFPTSWLLLPMQRLRGFRSVIVVESAFWRTAPQHSVSRRIWREFVERMNAFCLRRADLPIFTTDAYRRSMLGARPALVAPAAWVRAGDVLSEVPEREEAHGLRLIFAGRLTEAKGIRWLVEALRRHEIPPLQLDVFGTGPLEDWIRAAEVDRPDLRIRFMGTVAYGEPFFTTLRKYDALILPTLTDEQPRILFDAYSQALPVIASETEGTADYLKENEHGTSFCVQDEVSLVAALKRFDSLRQRWPEMRRVCLQTARRSTHENMHSERAQALRAMLQRGARRKIEIT